MKLTKLFLLTAFVLALLGSSALFSQSYNTAFEPISTDWIFQATMPRSEECYCLEKDNADGVHRVNINDKVFISVASEDPGLEWRLHQDSEFLKPLGLSINEEKKIITPSVLVKEVNDLHKNFFIQQEDGTGISFFYYDAIAAGATTLTFDLVESGSTGADIYDQVTFTIQVSGSNAVTSMLQ